MFSPLLVAITSKCYSRAVQIQTISTWALCLLFYSAICSVSLERPGRSEAGRNAAAETKLQFILCAQPNRENSFFIDGFEAALLKDMAVWSKGSARRRAQLPCPSPATGPCSQHSPSVLSLLTGLCCHFSALAQKINLGNFLSSYWQELSPWRAQKVPAESRRGWERPWTRLGQNTPAQKEPPAPALFWPALLSFNSYMTPEKSFYKRSLPVFKLPEFDCFTAL